MTEIELLTPTKVVYSKRKSISIIISNNGEMTIRAPLRCPDSLITKFIAEKSNWIIKKRIEFMNKPLIKLNLTENAEVNILGKNYIINLMDISNVRIKENNIIIPKVNTKEKFQQFLKRYSKPIFKDRLDYISKITGLKYSEFSISSAKTNWGSCSFKNSIHLNYRLILTDDSILNYVIIHELCHTVEKNHSKKFWNLVKTISPNYKSIKNKLNNYTYLLSEI